MVNKAVEFKTNQWLWHEERVLCVFVQTGYVQHCQITRVGHRDLTKQIKAVSIRLSTKHPRWRADEQISITVWSCHGNVLMM